MSLRWLGTCLSDRVRGVFVLHCLHSFMYVHARIKACVHIGRCEEFVSLKVLGENNRDVHLRR